VAGHLSRLAQEVAAHGEPRTLAHRESRVAPSFTHHGHLRGSSCTLPDLAHADPQLHALWVASAAPSATYLSTIHACMHGLNWTICALTDERETPGGWCGEGSSVFRSDIVTMRGGNGCGCGSDDVWTCRMDTRGIGYRRSLQGQVREIWDWFGLWWHGCEGLR
jgi:hypothetical protein